MPTFQVRNRRTKMVLGEVTVADPADVLNELKDATGSSIEEIALSLGSTVEEATAALDVIEIKSSAKPGSFGRLQSAPLPRRQLFASKIG